MKFNYLYSFKMLTQLHHNCNYFKILTKQGIRRLFKPTPKGVILHTINEHQKP